MSLAVRKRRWLGGKDEIIAATPFVRKKGRLKRCPVFSDGLRHGVVMILKTRQIGFAV